MLSVTQLSAAKLFVTLILSDSRVYLTVSDTLSFWHKIRTTVDIG